jgi:hypothetical protein
MRLENWSLLTILLVSNPALWRNEGKAEGRLGGSLPHVWREAGRKVRAQHRPATYEPASRPALSGFGQVVAHRADLASLHWRSRSASGIPPLLFQTRAELNSC